MWSRCMPGRGEGSSCAMLTTARPSCLLKGHRINDGAVDLAVDLLIHWLIRWIVSRLEKLAEVFYTYVGDLQPIADAVELDVDTVDVVFHYWLLKRKVARPIFHITYTHTLEYLNNTVQYREVLGNSVAETIASCSQ